ncbi:hypothetical protein AHF37_06383 [Paragonimus kellicotti]|nr:hypothetical protein AHF37_06383 [Paragonimus kellicotti]
MAFNCFTLKEAPEYRKSDMMTFDDASNNEPCKSNTQGDDSNDWNCGTPADESNNYAPVICNVETPGNSHGLSLHHSSVCSSNKSRTRSNFGRLRPITMFRQAGFTTSALTACVSAQRNESVRAQFEVDSLDEPHNVPHVGSRIRTLGCLVRSHSDSTCLSLKAASKPSDQSQGETSYVTGNIASTVAPCDFLSSNPGNATNSMRHGSSSELNTTPSRVSSVDLCDTHIKGPNFSISQVSTSCTTKTSPAPRTYQLICRDGVQCYELISESKQIRSDSSTNESDDLSLYVCASSPYFTASHDQVSNTLFPRMFSFNGDLTEILWSSVYVVSDVSEPNDEGITALHNAVCAGRTEIAEFLVRTAGADVNAGDTDGWTPLHCAASCANLPLARLLVEHGASLHARTLSDQETPLEKCDQGDEEAECEEYLFCESDRINFRMVQ